MRAEARLDGKFLLRSTHARRYTPPRPTAPNPAGHNPNPPPPAPINSGSQAARRAAMAHPWDDSPMNGSQVATAGDPEPATAPPWMRAEPHMSAAAASTLLAGSFAAMLLVGFGVWATAVSSYPLAFGLDLRGDRPYPFPWPEGVAVGLVLTILGAVVAYAVIRVASRTRTAVRSGVVLLCVVVAASAFASASMSGERRCAIRSYDSSIHCTSRARSATRDFTAIAVPAGVALAGLATIPSS